MIAPQPINLAKISKNQTIQGLLMLVSLTVSVVTIWYLIHQNKLTKLQIEKHISEANSQKKKEEPAQENFSGATLPYSARFHGRQYPFLKVA